MKKYLFFLIGFILFSCVNTKAREVYCTIEQDENKNIEIIPNEDYLTEVYWAHIMCSDIENNVLYEFETLNDAINRLSLFGWKLVKINNYKNNTVIVTMVHEAEYYELKSDREDVKKIFK